MGMLDDIVGAATSGQSSNPLVGLAMDAIKNHPGGVSGLVNSFNSQGLGSIMSSWISTGANQPITGDQLQSVLGSTQIANLAAKAGISPDQAKSALTQLLPQVIDKLSPNGQLPQGTLVDAAMSILKGKA